MFQNVAGRGATEQRVDWSVLEKKRQGEWIKLQIFNICPPLTTTWRQGELVITSSTTTGFPPSEIRRNMFEILKLDICWFDSLVFFFWSYSLLRYPVYCLISASVLRVCNILICKKYVYSILKWFKRLKCITRSRNKSFNCLDIWVYIFLLCIRKWSFMDSYTSCLVHPNYVT